MIEDCRLVAANARRQATRGCMGRLRSVQLAGTAVTFSFFLLFLLPAFLLLPACGGHKPAGASPFPARITLNPSTIVSMQVGSTMQFTASAQNGLNTAINPTFTYSVTPTTATGSSSPSGVLNISPGGFACAGSWNQYFNVCTPGASGVVQVVASALGASSQPTLVFVHPPIDNIQISFVAPVNAPPRACPGQTVLPAACDIQFNTSVCQPNQPCACLSQNQAETLQATAFSQGVDITALVGPFSFSQSNQNVLKITPIVTSSFADAPTNQVTIQSNIPGQSYLVASASGVSSQPYSAETCPVQCIALQLGTNGTQEIGTTNFVATKGTSETITATAVDVQGCIVPQPGLTWTSSAPAAIIPGSSSAGCGVGSSCNITTAQPGAASVTASCTPPTCNVGFPTPPPDLPALYVPQAVYPVTAISGLVTGITNSSVVFASSQDCYADASCTVALYDVATTSMVAPGATPLPYPPNSLLFDTAGDKAYAGGQYGSFLITVANLNSSSSSPFTSLTAAGTPLGLVTGKVIAVSPNGNLAIFSDTVSTPNQVYVVNSALSGTTTPLNINSATTAAFSPDNSKAFILGNGGTTLYVYSPLQALQAINLGAPAGSVVFSSSGSFALLAGANPSLNFAAYNTCNNSPVNLTAGIGMPPAALPSPPLFLKMVPAGNVALNGTLLPVPIEPSGLDFFFGVDNTGFDIIATNSAQSSFTMPSCPQTTTLAHNSLNPPTYYFPPTHVDLGYGTFHPINLFLSPDATKFYIITTDLGILQYDLSTNAVSKIPLIGNASPVAADITVDGTLLYVAGTDGMLHEIVTSIGIDQGPAPIFFPELVNSSNNFCYSSFSCALNLVAVKP
jgi:hypothetical protein